MNKKVKSIGSLNNQEHYFSLNQQIVNQCKRRMEWTHEWLQQNWNELYSKENYMALKCLQQTEIYHFNWYFTMSEKQFRYLITNLGPKMESLRPFRKKRFFSAEERLSITLRYLATGEVHSCKLYHFRASKVVIMNMIAEICLDIYNLLKDQYIRTPETKEEWLAVSNGFVEKYSIVGCLGSIAMGYIMGRKTQRSVSEFVKGFLTSIVDVNENFIYVDIDEQIVETDVNIYERTKFNKSIEVNSLCIPEATDNQPQHYFVGHKTLPMKPYLLRAAGLNFNTKDATSFSKEDKSNESSFAAIDVIADNSLNAYRKLANIFPVLSKPFETDSVSAKKITLGCIALYNFLRKTSSNFCENSEKVNQPNEPTRTVDGTMEYHDIRPITVKNNCLKLLQRQCLEECQNKRTWTMERTFENIYE